MQNGAPAVKRRRLDSRPDAARGSQRSRLFAPFRTIGLVSPTAVPFTSNPLGKTSFQLTTSVGRALQTYDLKRGLNLVFITRPQPPGPVTASAAWSDRILAAWSAVGRYRGVWIYKRGKKVGNLQTPPSLNEDIVQLVVFGSWIVGCCATQIQVWSAANGEHYTTLEPPLDGSNVLTGGICALPTYTNKICAGREDGSVEIWNVSSGKLIYRIHPPSSDVGAVSAIQPAPAVSLLAIAYVNGILDIHDIQADSSVLKLNAGSGELCPVTTIAFRTDGSGTGEDGRQAGLMATASFNSGNITLWDLNDGGRRMGTVKSAHGTPSHTYKEVSRGGVTKIEFLAGQAILVSSGLDNSLKTWIFDEVPFSPVPRLLHSRGGHAAPVTAMQFIPTDADGAEAGGKWLLSSSQDRSLWGWSLRRDGQSVELSQGQIQKKAKKLGLTANGTSGQSSGEQALKAPEIICMACCMNRDGGMGAMPGVRTIWASAKQLKGKSTSTEQHVNGWESVVTGHRGEKFARTWYWGRKRAGRWILDTSDGTPVNSVAISPCGTFAVLGSSVGAIDMYNLQSGMHRQRYPAKLTPSQIKQRQLERKDELLLTGEANGSTSNAQGVGGHTSAVTGLYVDNLNSTLVSCGEDGKVKFWDFMSGRLLHELDWSSHSAPTMLRPHRPTELVALACKDSSVRIVDIEKRRIVRELHGCVGRVSDLCHSNDGRWIVAASEDAVVRVWDMPTGHLIDAMRLRTPCTALAFSNTGEFLATSQQDSIGINLWTNRALFSQVSTRRIDDDEIADVDAPTASGEGGHNLIEGAYAEEAERAEETDESVALPTLDQLSREVETLSLVPRSRWQTLLNLEVIRARNKPTEAPKAPEKAPFFLPSLDGSGGSSSNAAKADGLNALAAADDQSSKVAAEASRVRKIDGGGLAQSRHVSALIRAGDSDGLIEHLKTLAPAASDIEIRSLNPSSEAREMAGFVDALTARLRARRDYELVQVWMALFLRCHGEIVQAQEDLMRAVERWREEQRKESARLQELSSYCAGVVSFLRNSR